MSFFIRLTAHRKSYISAMWRVMPDKIYGTSINVSLDYNYNFMILCLEFSNNLRRLNGYFFSNLEEVAWFLVNSIPLWCQMITLNFCFNLLIRFLFIWKEYFKFLILKSCSDLMKIYSGQFCIKRCKENEWIF